MTAPLNNLTDTWNNGATVFTGLKYNITNTASAAGSLLFDFQIGGVSVANIGKSGSFNLYNTNDGSGNYERGVFDWTTTSNVLTIGTQALGSGTGRNVEFVNAANVLFKWTSFSSTFAGPNPSNGGFDFADTAGGSNYWFRPGSNYGLQIRSDATLKWCNTTGAQGTADTGVSRSAAGVIALGNGSQGDGSATILAKTKAGAFTSSDVAAGTWALCRDTSGATTKLIYNNAGTLMTVALT